MSTRLASVSILAMLMMSACRPSAAESTLEAGRAITPLEAIEKASAGAAGVTGVFEMLVQSTGVSAGTVFLNSELDYRDRRCLSIALSPAAIKEMLRQSGIEPVVDLKGKRIRVYGTARAVKILIVNDAKEKPDMYYYQTHVPVSDPKNLVVVR